MLHNHSPLSVPMNVVVATCNNSAGNISEGGALKEQSWDMEVRGQETSSAQRPNGWDFNGLIGRMCRRLVLTVPKVAAGVEAFALDET